MKFLLIRQLGVVAAFAASLLTVPMASASIVSGSKVQVFGSALIDAAGNIVPRDEMTGLPAGPLPVVTEVGTSGNTGSFSGYNVPNPLLLVLFPNYSALIDSIPVAGPFGFTLLQLPAIVPGAGEPGPAFGVTSFRLDAWTVLPVPAGFFIAQGSGKILDAIGNEIADGLFLLSSQGFVPNSINSFSATLQATVIPLPGALWIFGSGLLLMTAVMRRKVD